MAGAGARCPNLPAFPDLPPPSQLDFLPPSGHACCPPRTTSGRSDLPVTPATWLPIFPAGTPPPCPLPLPPFLSQAANPSPELKALPTPSCSLSPLSFTDTFPRNLLGEIHLDLCSWKDTNRHRASGLSKHLSLEGYRSGYPRGPLPSAHSYSPLSQGTK